MFKNNITLIGNIQSKSRLHASTNVLNFPKKTKTNCYKYQQNASVMDLGYMKNIARTKQNCSKLNNNAA